VAVKNSIKVGPLVFLL